MDRIRWLAMFVLSAHFGCATPSGNPTANVHASAMGYRVEVPPDWQVVDRAGLAAMGEATADNDWIDPGTLASVRSHIESGNMEFFFLATGTKTFRDNVNVLRTAGTLPPTKDAVPATCAATARQISEAFRVTVSIHRCELAQVGGRRFFVVDSSNPTQRTRTIAYAAALTSSTMLVVTGAFSEETVAVNGERLRAFVESMEIDSKQGR